MSRTKTRRNSEADPLGPRDFDLTPRSEDERRRRFALRILLWAGGGLVAIIALLALLIWALAASGLLIGGPAESYGSTAPAPTTVDDQGRTIAAPSWRVLPRPEFPSEAARNGVEQGSAVLSCAVTAGGVLAGCEVVSETPPGMGFGAAALASTGTAKMRPSTIDGAAVGGRARFTVRFRLQ